jgi:hypothetical protein
LPKGTKKQKKCHKGWPELSVRQRELKDTIAVVQEQAQSPREVSSELQVMQGVEAIKLGSG